MSFPHPYFYHWLEPANLPSVRRHGLLSTERLLALANVPDDERQAILSTQRVDSLVLPGGVIVRDQSPIPPGALAKALPPGMTPSDWYRLLNRYVFLWASAERADSHRGAFRTRAALLLVFDAARLLAERGEEVFLSPINSGNARRKPSPRSERLFVPYLEWLETGWPLIQGQRRSRSFPPAEIVLRDHLPLEPYLVEIRVQDA